MSAPTPAIPQRDPHAHKGALGTVAVIAGTAANTPNHPRMLGAPAITARAAIRAGAGLTKLLVPEPIANHTLTLTPEATAIPLPVDQHHHIDTPAALPVLDHTLNTLRTPPSPRPGIGVVAIGPGLGPPTDATRAILLRCLTQDTTPVVIDADAINALATMPDAHRDLRAPAVITPHPGEAGRLIDAFQLDASPRPDSEQERHHTAQTIAAFLGCICILKSHTTTIASPVEARTVDAPPNPALATPGSGDVLTGVTAALIAQFVRTPLIAGEHTRASEDLGGLPLLDAAHLAAAAHARAASLWANATTPQRTTGLLATELTDHLPLALEHLRNPNADSTKHP